MKLLLDENLSLVWGQPPQVIRLRTLNQHRAATLKVLIDNKDVIHEALLTCGMAAVEVFP